MQHYYSEGGIWDYVLPIYIHGEKESTPSLNSKFLLIGA